LSPDGSRFLSASIDPGDAYLHLWDAQSGKEIRSFREGHGAMSTMSAVFSTDGRRILSGSWDQTMRLWDVAGGQLLHHFQLPGYVYAVALSPDGRRALAGVGDAVYLLGPDPKYKGLGRGAIHVFDLATASEHHFVGKSVIVSLAVAPSGRYALSGNFAGEIELWRLPR
jgi:WD40 repeat protein